MGSILRFNEHTFSKLIEDVVVTRRMTYIEAVLYVCEKEDLEPDSVAALISIPIKEKLQLEGQEINLVKKSTPKLDFL